MPKYLIDPNGMTDMVKTDKGVFAKGEWVTLTVKEAANNPNLIPENEVKKRIAKLEGDKNKDDEDDKDDKDKKGDEKGK
jgi:hypothetical protein